MFDIKQWRNLQDDCYKIIDLCDGVESVSTKRIEDRYFF